MLSALRLSMGSRLVFLERKNWDRPRFPSAQAFVYRSWVGKKRVVLPRVTYVPPFLRASELSAVLCVLSFR
jgi:hypothetical protein